MLRPFHVRERILFEIPPLYRVFHSRVGVNKERVYGHFGSKEGLFAATVAAAMDELTEAVGKPGDDVAQWVGSVYDFHRERPELLRLLLWEALHQREPAVVGEQDREEGYSVNLTRP